MSTLSPFLMDAAWPLGQRPAVHLRGAPNLKPMMEAVAEDFMAEHHEVAVSVQEGFSWRGHKSVIDGTADVGMISGPLPRELKKLVEERGLELETKVVALDGVVMVVHPSNPVRDISLSQLRGVFSGHHHDWTALGGNRVAIQPFSQPPYVSSFDEFIRKVMGDAVFTPKMRVGETKLILSKVASTPGAIGYIATNFLTDQVRAVSLNGIPANPETLRNGTYPLRRELSLVIRKGGNPLPAQLVDYALKADKGQRYARKSGAIPVNPSEG